MLSMQKPADLTIPISLSDSATECTVRLNTGTRRDAVLYPVHVVGTLVDVGRAWLSALPREKLGNAAIGRMRLPKELAPHCTEEDIEVTVYPVTVRAAGIERAIYVTPVDNEEDAALGCNFFVDLPRDAQRRLFSAASAHSQDGKIPEPRDGV
eukprot:Polyplicarium_translucidae@DN1336_c0_g1_i2.p3